MTGYKIRFVNVIYVLAIIMADFLIYMILGVLFMGYEDFYIESKGEYMSLKSMTTRDKMVYC